MSGQTKPHQHQLKTPKKKTRKEEKSENKGLRGLIRSGRILKGGGGHGSSLEITVDRN